MHCFTLPRAAPSACGARGRAGSLAAAPAAAAVAAAAAAALRARQSGLQQRSVVARVRIEDIDQLPEVNPAAEALQDYQQLEQSGQLNSVTANNVRIKYGIRRGEDGRVQLRRSDGTWMQLKLDMEMRGTILLRNTVDDSIYVLQTERLEQVDLSDDYLLFMLFADGSWQEQILPIQIRADNGDPSVLEMGEQQFKDYVGVIKTLQEAEMEAAAVTQDGDDGAIDVTPEVLPSTA